MLALDFESLFVQVELVAGKGRRRDARLCIMSFVALLAGERHTDAPVTASSFVRHFAIVLNDAMPHAQRQKLKLFAPRLIGTNDGFDGQRAVLVRQVFQAEVAPRISDDYAAGLLPSQIGGDATGFTAGYSPVSHNQLDMDLDQDCSFIRNRAAATAARILVDCAVLSANEADRRWYWAKALDLLDRMSELGRDSPFLFDANALPAAARMLTQARCSETLLPIIERVLHAVKRRLGQRAAFGCSDQEPMDVEEPAPIATAALDHTGASSPVMAT